MAVSQYAVRRKRAYEEMTYLFTSHASEVILACCLPFDMSYLQVQVLCRADEGSLTATDNCAKKMRNGCGSCTRSVYYSCGQSAGAYPTKYELQVRVQATFVSGFMLVGAAYCECMAVFTLDDRGLRFSITSHLHILPVRRAESPYLLLQSKLLGALHLSCK